MANILLVEDEDSIRFVMKEILESALDDSTVAAAATGREFLRLLAVDTPDLILLDVRLPDIDGLTLYHEVRRQDGLESVPVLFVTANPDLVSRAKLTGHYAALRKPFDLDMLIEAVQDLLEQPMALG